MVNHATALRTAAALVRRGWTQGTYDDFNGRVCAAGAIGYAIDRDVAAQAFRLRSAGASALPPETWQTLTETQAVLDTVKRLLRIDSVQDWNDGKGQTQEAVAAGLEFVALIWEQEQQMPRCAACAGRGICEVPRTVIATQIVAHGLYIVAVEGPITEFVRVPCAACHGSGRTSESAGHDATRPGVNALPSSQPAETGTVSCAPVIAWT